MMIKLYVTVDPDCKNGFRFVVDDGELKHLENHQNYRFITVLEVDIEGHRDWLITKAKERAEKEIEEFQQKIVSIQEKADSYERPASH